MTTTDYLSRELRRARLSLHRAEKKPNTPESEMQGLRDKIACLEEALEAVQGNEQARAHLDRDAWEPCDHCKPAEYPPDYYGTHEFPIVGNEIYYYDTDDGWEGEEINFCPWCCRPLTDAAWAELERRVCGG